MKSRRGLLVLLLFAGLVLALEKILIALAASRDVSMALLAAGGSLPVGAILLALAAMLSHLFARLVLPGLVLQALVLAAFQPRRPTATAMESRTPET